MNEEELKKGCGKDLKRKAFENPSLSLYCGIEIFVSESVDLKVILCQTCKAKLEYFQKGKLEQKKEFYDKITEKIILLKKGCRVHCGYRVDTDLLEKVSVKCGDIDKISGEGHLGTECKNRIKDLEQLQKEIGEEKGR